MLHVTYLQGLCQRRSWPEPSFECHRTYTGYTCTVRVNNRDFKTSSQHPTPEMAMDGAAMQAYMYCRDVSKNSAQPRASGGTLQGTPAPVGTGRSKMSHAAVSRMSQASSNFDSRRFSSSDSGSDRRSSVSSSASFGTCSCGTSPYRAFDRCEMCIRRERVF